MNDESFMLNGRFTINPVTGLVNDTLLAKETRIEPRLMSLLALLVTNRETLVSRELITKEIWNDYGNAEEGLTQAISYLRKVLADDKKELIETVPKKGYILHAAFSRVPAVKQTSMPKQVIKPIYIWIVGIALVLIITAWFILTPKPPANSDVKDAIQNHVSPDTGNKVHNPDMLPDSANKLQSGDGQK
jgi:DNA-binding winged helix-turn-helix (wHTH) protein